MDSIVFAFQASLVVLPAAYIMTTPWQTTQTDIAASEPAITTAVTEFSDVADTYIVQASSKAETNLTVKAKVAGEKNQQKTSTKNNFTIQLGSSPDKHLLLEQANTLPQETTQPLYIYPYKVTKSGKPVYGLSYGEYGSKETALRASRNLPANVREFGVWVRSLSKLKKQNLKQVTPNT